MRSSTARALTALAVGAVLSAVSASAAGAITPGPLAGYSAAPTAAATQSVTATFEVPRFIKCKGVPSTGTQAVDDGARIDEPSSSPSGSNSGAGVVMVCFGSSGSYLPHIQVNGMNISSSITVAAGDIVTVSAEISSVAVSVTLKDGLQEQTETGTGSSATALDVGAIAANCNAMHECLPVPHVGVSKFGSVLIDGVSPQAAGATKKELVDAKEEVEMKSSPLKLKTKQAFNVNWVKSCGLEGVC